jgi:adenylosuccinate synthase
MALDILIGLQWGDEGKGKVVDYFASGYHIVARFQGGPNAGHTIYVNNEKLVLHQVPSGVLHPDCQCVIGNAVVLDPLTLAAEFQALKAHGIMPEDKLVISARCHLILPTHRLLDKALESNGVQRKIGSTLRGIGPAYQDKYGRQGLRVGDIFSADFDTRLQMLAAQHQKRLTALGYDYSQAEILPENWLQSLELLRTLAIKNTESLLLEAHRRGAAILAEGAQGTLLDVEFGQYPYVTSSHTTAAGACIGLGLPPSSVRKVIGIFKAYCTRVGEGPFPTELTDKVGEMLRQRGGEFGATTGRPRRCGWLDLPALRFACQINGTTELVMTKADILAGLPNVQLCTAYQPTANESFYIDSGIPVYQTFNGWKNTDPAAPLDDSLTAYITAIEQQIAHTINFVSLGAARDQIIARNNI